MLSILLYSKKLFVGKTNSKFAENRSLDATVAQQFFSQKGKKRRKKDRKKRKNEKALKAN